MNKLYFELKSFFIDNQHVIDDCSFSIEPAKTVAFIGPSGCGKTTLLNTIAGLRVFDHYRSPRQPKLGYIFQESRLIPWLSIFENLALIQPNASKQEIESSLTKVKLNNITDDYPNTLSGGMQKRVSIARCFINKPKLVLMDEPFTSLDAPTAQHLIALVNQLLLDYESSAILITHNLAEAIQMADIIYFLSNKPTRIIKTFVNPLRHGKQENEKTSLITDDQAIAQLESSLLTTHPQLLSGLL